MKRLLNYLIQIQEREIVRLHSTGTDEEREISKSKLIKLLNKELKWQQN